MDEEWMVNCDRRAGGGLPGRSRPFDMFKITCFLIINDVFQKKTSVWYLTYKAKLFFQKELQYNMFADVWHSTIPCWDKMFVSGLWTVSNDDIPMCWATGWTLSPRRNQKICPAENAAFLFAVLKQIDIKSLSYKNDDYGEMNRNVYEQSTNSLSDIQNGRICL